MDIKKYYCKETRLFYIEFEPKIIKACGEQKIIKTYKTFRGFVKRLNGDLSGADLYDYNFVGIDLHKYNLDGAGICSNVLKVQGLYDNSFYETYVKIPVQLLTDTTKNNYSALIEAEELSPQASKNTRIQLIDNGDSCRENCIYYISDLHLNHKIATKFKESATRQDVEDYIKHIVSDLCANLSFAYNSVLLIGGDVSYNFEIAKIFYSELKKRFHGSICVVLGNHDLWALDIDSTNPSGLSRYDFVVSKYTELFQKLGIDFLNDCMIAFKENRNNFRRKKYIITNTQIRRFSKNKLREFLKDSFCILFGGIGFSGCNPGFNATHCIYRGTIPTIEEDIERTESFEMLYTKLEEYIPDYNLIVLTHTPKDDWSNNKYRPNWIYVSGHTHRNYFKCDETAQIYADNQSGYSDTRMTLRQFYSSSKYDIFNVMDDGCHEISSEAYIDFYRGQHMSIKYSWKDTSIFILKKQGCYCFFMKQNSTGKMFLLRGGAIRSMQGHTLEYFYEHMDKYALAVKEFLQPYYAYQKEVAKVVKSFGGQGIIHGCIIDVSFLSHIYVNPFDGTLTPYYAESICDRIIYKDINGLIAQHEKDLLPAFESEQVKAQTSNLAPDNRSLEISDAGTYDAGTQIYQVSSLMRSLQHTADNCIIRSWNDNLIQNFDEAKNQRALGVAVMQESLNDALLP